ncbi:MAG: aminotransferase class V-fold PLP-dependent enzyme [Chloroflexota bacterium]|nr:aminotransferase class V-fold PLP-dependent enzyme [Chloroflexota bacterium]
MDINKLRSQIPATQNVVYMNTGWSGPSPISVVDAIVKRLEIESSLGPASPQVLASGRETRQDLREALASFLHVRPSELTLTQNTTEGQNIVINGLDWKPGDEVITFSLEHNSVLVPCYYLERRHGTVTKLLPLSPDEDQESIVTKVEAAITPRTRLIFMSHVQFKSGLRMPVEQLQNLARAKSVLTLIDGAQGVGHIDLDLRELGVDFYAMPGHKWMMGPDGVGSLYIREELIPRVQPMKVSGHAVDSGHGYRNFAIKHEDIQKFELTTTNDALWAGYREAIRFREQLLVGEAEQHSLELASQAKASLAAIPGVFITSPLEGPGCTGLVTFAVEGWEPADLVNALEAEKEISIRAVSDPANVRMSLAFFNTEAEVDRVANAVRGMVK